MGKDIKARFKVSDLILTPETLYLESIAREIENKIRDTYYPALSSLKKAFEPRLEE